MAYKKIFIDSDILLDLFLKREPFVKFSQILLQYSKNHKLKLYTSTLIIANIHYLIAKNFNKQIAKEQLKTLLELIEPLSFEPVDINSALISEYVDFEDAIQYFIARKNHCDLIISRNIKHYKKFDLPVSSAEQFLRTV